MKWKVVYLLQKGKKKLNKENEKHCVIFPKFKHNNNMLIIDEIKSFWENQGTKICLIWIESSPQFSSDHLM